MSYTPSGVHVGVRCREASKTAKKRVLLERTDVLPFSTHGILSWAIACSSLLFRIFGLSFGDGFGCGSALGLAFDFTLAFVASVLALVLALLCLCACRSAWLCYLAFFALTVCSLAVLCFLFSWFSALVCFVYLFFGLLEFE